VQYRACKKETAPGGNPEAVAKSPGKPAGAGSMLRLKRRELT